MPWGAEPFLVGTAAQDFDAMCTASVAWSFATLGGRLGASFRCAGCSDEALWDALAAHVRLCVASCKTQASHGLSELALVAT